MHDLNETREEVTIGWGELDGNFCKIVNPMIQLPRNCSDVYGLREIVKEVPNNMFILSKPRVFGLALFPRPVYN